MTTAIIPFSRVPYFGDERSFLDDALASGHLGGDGRFTSRVNAYFEQQLRSVRTFMTPSCTAALEMTALLLRIGPGDEVIMPSYTFVSTASAFVLRGALVKFVDIRPDTMNIDEKKIEAAITPRTRAIAVVHYAGIACEMNDILEIANSHGLGVVEDAAQGVFSRYFEQPLGTFGSLAAFSFHESKNLTSGGEGGLLAVNDPALVERAEIIRDKGTNRRSFLRGEIDKYSWIDVGSSYLASELQAAHLCCQLEHGAEIQRGRMGVWRTYRAALDELAHREFVELPHVPCGCEHNGHMFWLKCRSMEERDGLLIWLKEHGVQAAFHYVPLHSSRAGRCYGEFVGRDTYTTAHSSRLLRLPLYYGLSSDDVERVAELVRQFFHG